MKRIGMRIVTCFIFVMIFSTVVCAEETEVVSIGENGTITISKTLNADETETTITVTSSNVTGAVDLSLLDEMGSTIIIGTDAFARNENITSVTLPENTVSIGACAFEQCKSLSSITIPDNCSSIMNYAFNFAGLTEVVFPKNLTSLGCDSFYGNGKLLKCVFHNSELDLSESGLDYKNSYSTEPLVFWCNDGLSENCPSAFAKANGIKRLMLDGSQVVAENRKKFDLETGTITVEYGEETEGITDRLTIIDSDGVQGDIDLSFLETEATHVVVGKSAFEKNTDLTSVILPDNTVEIGEYAFGQCSNLEKCDLPGEVKVIGKEAFRGVKISSVQIPSSCTELGNSVYQTANIESITFEDGDKSLTIGDDAFRFCSDLTTVNLPERLISMGSGAFAYCSSLAGISVPDNCSTIGGAAFLYATSLNTVKLPASLESIEWSCFCACSKLKDITLPSNCAYIDTCAFQSCNLLTSITIPASCTEIGSQAFDECGSLQTVIFENADTEINATAFSEANQKLVLYSSISDKANSPYQFCKDYSYEWNNILQDIHVVTPVSKTEYVYGEEFDYSTIVLEGDYKTEDGYVTKTLSPSKWTMSGYDKNTLGVQQLHFVCDEVQDSSNIKVSVYYDMNLVTVDIENPYYTGKEQEAKPNIYWIDDKEESHVLAEGKDYRIVSYSNNIYVGEETNQAAVNIEGVGDYKGSITKSFAIQPVDIGICEVDLIEDELVVTITDLSGETEDKVMLVCGKDYLISDEDTDDSTSETQIKVVLKGINNYTGEKIAYFDKKPNGEETSEEETTTEVTTEEKPTEEKPTEVTTEEKPTEEKPTEVTTEEKPTEEKTTEVTTEEKPTEEKTTEVTTEEKTTKEKPTEVTTEKKPTLKKGDKFIVSKNTYLITGKSTVTFVNCTDKKLKSLVIPKTVKKNGHTYKVTKIAKKACYKYSKLISVYVGDYVVMIGDQAFASCSNLSKITIGTGVTTLGEEVFCKDKKLKKITIKTKKLNKIKKDSFKGVNKKVKIAVPKSKVKEYNRLING